MNWRRPAGSGSGWIAGRRCLWGVLVPIAGDCFRGTRILQYQRRAVSSGHLVFGGVAKGHIQYFKGREYQVSCQMIIGHHRRSPLSILLQENMRRRICGSDPTCHSPYQHDRRLEA